MQTVLYQPSRSSAGGGRTEHSGGQKEEETADTERKQVRPRSVASGRCKSEEGEEERVKERRSALPPRLHRPPVKHSLNSTCDLQPLRAVSHAPASACSCATLIACARFCATRVPMCSHSCTCVYSGFLILELQKCLYWCHF